jgi:anti-sigma regulatory factor (Ser/Thr protein kinase)
VSFARLPAELDSLATIRAAIKEAAIAAGLAPAAAYRLMLAVDEVATNVILHGYQEHQLTGNVDLSVEVEGDRLVVRLEDDAVPFDPCTLDLPDAEDLARPLEERPVGGLGVMLAMEGVDEFNYSRAGERNRNSFMVALKK